VAARWTTFGQFDGDTAEAGIQDSGELTALNG